LSRPAKFVSDLNSEKMRRDQSEKLKSGMASKPCDRLILERLYAYEDQVTGHTDALDAKANYLLVAETFIAGLATLGLQSSHMGLWGHLICLLGIISLGYAGMQAWNMFHLENFDAEYAPDLAIWRDGIIQANPEAADHVIEQLVCEGLSKGAVERIEKKISLNKRRVALLESSYNATFLALGLVLFSLITLIF
jgi:hypothetical protein